MKDQGKTKQQLMAEIEDLRRRVATLEKAATDGSREEKELRRSEAKWRSVVENAPLFVAVVDRSGEMQFLNRFRPGFDSEGVLGRPFYDFLQPQYRALAQRSLEHVFQTGERAYFECVGAGPEGNVSEYATDIGPVIIDGEVVAATLVSSDITDRKRAEEALRQSVQRLSLHFQQTPLGAIEWDLNFQVTRWNPGAESIFGYSLEEAQGRHSSFVVPPTARDHVDRIWKDLLTRRGGERSTNQNVTKDGRTILCEWYNTPLVDAEGNVIGVASLVDDITERIRAEKALQQARDELEQRVKERTAELAIFHKFAEAAGQGFGMADLDGVITYMNPAACHLAGIAGPDDAVGKHLATYYPKEYMARRETEILPALFREGYWEGEVVASRGGKTLHVLQHSFLIRDENENPSHLASVLTDITERKLAEAALRESEEKHRALVETSPDAVIMTDLRGHVTFASGQLLEMHGSDSIDELLGRSPFDFIAKEDHQRFSDNLRRTIEEGVTRNIEYCFLRRDRTRMPGEVSAAVIRHASGEPMALVAILRDITDRKRTQEALERQRRALQHMLRASDHERQTIAYDIHDGLAQQLAGALMQFETYDHVRKTKPKQAADAFQAGLTMLRQGHFEARRLISGVRPPILDEAGLLAAISHLILEQTGAKRPEIEFRSKVIFERLEAVEENAIFRIVQEGVTNACKHSESEKVRVSLLQRGDRVRVEIRDWGIGFDLKEVPENRFGLTGIRQRAQLLGGKCSIQSRAGDGTAIVVDLPVVESKIEG